MKHSCPSKQRGEESDMHTKVRESKDRSCGHHRLPVRSAHMISPIERHGAELSYESDWKLHLLMLPSPRWPITDSPLTRINDSNP